MKPKYSEKVARFLCNLGTQLEVIRPKGNDARQVNTKAKNVQYLATGMA